MTTTRKNFRRLGYADASGGLGDARNRKTRRRAPGRAPAPRFCRQSDRIRKELAERGILLEDAKDGERPLETQMKYFHFLKHDRVAVGPRVPRNFARPICVPVSIA